jgi:NDP-sugar pyrophosphorylase family protein
MISMIPTISEKIFILVGGLGTRLKPIISDIPKPMAPIDGKPFLWYKLMQFKSVGFKNFVFCAGYLSDYISDYFGDGSNFGVKIDYSVEKEPLGTAGAIANAEKFIDGPFFIGNGDTYLDFEAKPMLNFINEKKGKYGMLLTKPHEKGQEGMVVVDADGLITDFVEKPEKEVPGRQINAGVYLIHPDILELIPKSKKISMEKDVFPELITRNEPFYGFGYEGYFIDIGLPKNYHRFCQDIENKKISF